MNVFKRLWCRAFQFVFHVVMPFLPYKNPTRLHSCEEAAETLVKENRKKPLIVTDKGIVACGLVEPVKAALEAKGIPYEVYSDTVVNPTIQNAEEGAKLYLESGCDSLIAIGGGSAMDCAKGIGLRILKPRRTFRSMKGILKVFGKLPLYIACPTTSGTGSETTIAAVIVDEKTRDKFTVIDFCLCPKYALLDPVMTKGLPPKMTSTTGMDALTHAVEAYIGGSTIKKTRKLSVEAVKAIRANLYEAYIHPDNMQARRRMQYAAYCAGLSFTISYVGYVHAVAHSLGGKYNTPHGLANSVILPYVLKDYCIYGRKKIAKLSRLTGVSEVNTTDEEACSEFIAWIEDLNKKMDIPVKLRVDKEDIPALAAHADAEANPLYPVPYLMNAKALEKIYYEIRDEYGDLVHGDTAQSAGK
ncbi:MAG: iron-containing alcohol dehydrogenase [Clostridia bacterium]|nr:iron-containing alcohol dehydrogenase [Clostridia bacterium]